MLARILLSFESFLVLVRSTELAAPTAMGWADESGSTVFLGEDDDEDARGFFLLERGLEDFAFVAAVNLGFVFDFAAVLAGASLGPEWLLLSARGVCFEGTAATLEEGSMAEADIVSTTLSLEATVLMDGQEMESFRDVKV